MHERLEAFVATQGGLEIDLIIERPGQKTILLEIKSSEIVSDQKLKHLQALAQEDESFEAICLSREKFIKKVDKVTIYPWAQGLQYLGLSVAS